MPYHIYIVYFQDNCDAFLGKKYMYFKKRFLLDCKDLYHINNVKPISTLKLMPYHIFIVYIQENPNLLIFQLAKTAYRNKMYLPTKFSGQKKYEYVSSILLVSTQCCVHSKCYQNGRNICS